MKKAKDKPRKKINSIHYAGKVIALGSWLIGFSVPFLFLSKYTVCFWIGRILVGLGAAVLLGIAIWLIIESIQDAYWEKHDMMERYSYKKVREGVYECQNCGNRNVKKGAKSCEICGCRFK